MWDYEKRLQYPVNIKTPNAKLAQFIISQYGGPDGELAASMRYLSQRYASPYREVSALLTDIGTEELAHFEMIGTIVHQLTRNLSMEEIEASGLGPYYIDHTIGLWPQAAGGVPFNANQFQSKGDIITDLFEDMAAEYQKGNYVICGGDFNHDFTGDSSQKLNGARIHGHGAHVRTVEARRIAILPCARPKRVQLRKDRATLGKDRACSLGIRIQRHRDHGIHQKEGCRGGLRHRRTGGKRKQKRKQ